jgi:hypothetical protein
MIQAKKILLPLGILISTLIVISLIIFLLINNLMSRASSSGPTMRDRIYSIPLGYIQFVKIKPYYYTSLVTNNVLITDKSTITNIMTAVRLAKPYFPKHPVTQWQCFLIVSDGSGESYIWVNKTFGQGTILYCQTSLNGGLIYDTRQSDTVGSILEKVTKN